MAKKKDDAKVESASRKVWGLIGRDEVNDLLALLEPEQGRLEDWLGPKMPSWLKSAFMQRVLGFIRRRIENAAEKMDAPILGPIIEKTTDMTFRAVSKDKEGNASAKISDWKKKFYEKALKDLFQNPTWETQDKLKEEFFTLRSFNEFFERETAETAQPIRKKTPEREWKEFLASLRRIDRQLAPFARKAKRLPGAQGGRLWSLF